jgi:hypothetical protein
MESENPGKEEEDNGIIIYTKCIMATCLIPSSQVLENEANARALITANSKLVYP